MSLLHSDLSHADIDALYATSMRLRSDATAAEIRAASHADRAAYKEMRQLRVGTDALRRGHRLAALAARLKGNR